MERQAEETHKDADRNDMRALYPITKRLSCDFGICLESKSQTEHMVTTLKENKNDGSNTSTKTFQADLLHQITQTSTR